MERNRRLPASRARLLVALILGMLLGASPVSGAVLSMDLGSEWLKVAVVNPRPGQSPIAVAINEMSKRKSPALVAFSSGERLLAESAAGITARYPERVYSGVRDMVGKSAEQVRQQLARNYLPFDVVEDDRGAASIRIHDQHSEYTSQELLAMVLRYGMELGEAHVQGVIKDAVITVPPYFGQAERRAVQTAAEIAGISLLSLINEHSGAALQYGIDKDFTNETRHVVFYDMGANSVYAAVVTYSSYSAKEKGKPVTSNQFQVRGVRWDASVGGQTMEMRLVEHFADQFNSQVGGGLDVRNFPKAMAKLKKQVKRTKEILSANLDAPLSVESIYDDRDFRSTITRERFEELCGDIWERALLPLKQVLADTGLSLKDVYAVELLGGATRVPKLQAVLSEFLGKQELDRHLDSDEAIVLGAALQAANISDGFKLNRKIGMIDGVQFGIVLKLEGSQSSGFESYDDTGIGADQPLLVPRLLKKVPSKVFRSFKNVNEDFTATLSYDPAGLLPPGVLSSEFSSFKVSGVADAFTKYASLNLSAPIKTTLHFSISRSGVINLDRAETVVEVSEWYEIPVQNTTVDTNQTATQETSGQTENISKTEAVEEGKVEPNDQQEELGENPTGSKPLITKKLRKRTIRVPLKVKDVTSGPGRALSEEAVAKAVQRISELNMKDAEKRRTAEAKNSLEAYIYATKDKLDSLEGIEKVTTEKQLEGFRSDLVEVEDWLYTDGEQASALEFVDRLSSLQKTGDDIFFRLDELKTRPAVLQYAKDYFVELETIFKGWDIEKPWISDSRKDEVKREWKSFEKWLDEKETQQKKLEYHEKPALVSEDVFVKIADLKDKVSKLDRTPKPKPKVIEPVTKGSESSENLEKVAENLVNEQSILDSDQPVDDSSKDEKHDEL